MSNPAHHRQPGHSAPITREEMLKRVARFDPKNIDANAFPDLKSESHNRSVIYMLSKDSLAGPAQIDAEHNFHLAILTMEPGVRPVRHAHPYNEVFMPINATFRFFWGEENAEHIDLNPMDVISVPAGVFRTFENTSDKTANVMAIFDERDDPHTGIVVPQDVYDEFYKDGWTPGSPPKS